MRRVICVCMKYLKQPTPENTITDFRFFLQNELINRCKKNQSYSLRSFAKSLQIEPSALSKILNGKRVAREKTLTKLCNHLSVEPDQLEKFKLYLKNRKRVSKENETSKTSFNELALDTFRIISDWYHYAILELVSVRGFVENEKWIAKVLGITVSEVNIAVERLVRLKFLKITKDGKWINISGGNTTMKNEFTAIAFRKLQKQILKKAIVALEEVPFEKRDQTSMTMAIDSHLLPEAKERITKFRRELCMFLQNNGKKDHVYNLSISLYPLTDMMIK